MEKIYNYRLHGIDLMEKCLYQVPIDINTQFNFTVSTQGAIDNNRKIVVIVVDIILKKLNDTEVVAKFTGALGFELQDFENVLDKSDNGVYLLPDVLENNLKMISISTMRGIIYSELRGTSLNSAILPVVTLDSLRPTNIDIIGEMRQKMSKK